MFPEPTELRVTACSMESIWTPKSKSNTLTPKTQLADKLTKGNFTRDEWDHFVCLFNIGHLMSTNCLKSMSKRKQKDSGEDDSHSKIEADDEFGLAMLRDGILTCLLLQH